MRQTIKKRVVSDCRCRAGCRLYGSSSGSSNQLGRLLDSTIDIRLSYNNGHRCSLNAATGRPAAGMPRVRSIKHIECLMIHHTCNIVNDHVPFHSIAPCRPLAWSCSASKMSLHAVLTHATWPAPVTVVGCWHGGSKGPQKLQQRPQMRY